MPRAPSHYCDFYLEPHNDAVRRSALPADLARYVDGQGDDELPFVLSGTVLHYLRPRPLAARVGRVCTSILPAALDDLVRRRADGGASFFFDPFALFIVDGLPPRARLARAALRRQIIDALADHFESLDDPSEPAGRVGSCEQLAEQVVDECEPQLTRFDVSFRFEPAPKPRGERLFEYLYDVRPSSLAPAPWPEQVAL